MAQAAAKAASDLVSPPPLTIGQVRIGLTLMAIHRGDKSVLADQYPHLMFLKGTMFAWGNISGDRILGLCAAAMGQPERAAAHFEDALAFCRKAGFGPELAWTCCDYADLLLSEIALPDLLEGQRDKATKLLSESFAIATELGMRPLEERVLARQEKSES